MKLRSVLLAFVLAFLVGGLAVAAAAEPAPAAPVQAAVAPASAAPGGPLPALCGTSPSPAPLPAADLFAAKSTFAEVCGACSVPACRGVVSGSVGCSPFYPTARCIDALGSSCTDGTPRCQCWNGPLP
jgi:hypothetical protein